MKRNTPAIIQDLSKTPGAVGIGVTGVTYNQATQEFLDHRLDFSIEEVDRGLADIETLQAISNTSLGVYGEVAGSIGPQEIISTLNNLRQTIGLASLPVSFRVLSFQFVDIENRTSLTNYEIGE